MGPVGLCRVLTQGAGESGGSDAAPPSGWACQWEEYNQFWKGLGCVDLLAGRWIIAHLQNPDASSRALALRTYVLCRFFFSS